MNKVSRLGLHRQSGDLQMQNGNSGLRWSQKSSQSIGALGTLTPRSNWNRVLATSIFFGLALALQSAILIKAKFSFLSMVLEHYFIDFNFFSKKRIHFLAELQKYNSMMHKISQQSTKHEYLAVVGFCEFFMLLWKGALSECRKLRSQLLFHGLIT